MKNIKAISKWLLGAALASAFILAAPHKADAQVVVSAGFNNYAPVAVGFYGPNRYDGWRRREAFEHGRWERDHFRYRHFDRRGYRRY